MRKIFSSTFWTKVGVVLFVGVFLLGTGFAQAATSAKIVQEDITTTIAVFAVELGSVKDFKTKMFITCVDKDGKETKEPGSQVSTTEKFIVACKGLNTGSLYSYTIYPEDNSFFSKLTGTFTTKTAPVTTTTIDPDDTTKPPASNGYGCVSTDTSAYCMLAPLPIPDANGNIDPTGKINVKEGVGIYIESIIKLVIGIIGVLAVLMIVIGGIEYMSTISLGEKEGAKSRIMNALFGLLLALGSYILLNTINPALTDVSVNITGVDLGGSGVLVEGESVTVTPETEFIVKDPNSGVKISKPTTQETSDEMAKICKPWDRKMDCEGITSMCKKYAARIDAVVSDPELARFMKVNMVEESACDITKPGKMTKYGRAYGIFQQLPTTAQTYAKQCSVVGTITGSWLSDPQNIDKIICIQEKFIRYIQSTQCGTDWRNVAAAQGAGPGWCKPSKDCKNETSCIPANKPVKAWECPYDNPEHTKKNTDLEEARNASKKMMYCMDHPSSWM